MTSKIRQALQHWSRIPKEPGYPISVEQLLGVLRCAGLDVEVIPVIRLRPVRGKGTDDDPFRSVWQYWSADGKLIAEYDPTADEEQMGG